MFAETGAVAGMSAVLDTCSFVGKGVRGTGVFVGKVVSVAVLVMEPECIPPQEWQELLSQGELIS